MVGRIDKMLKSTGRKKKLKSHDATPEKTRAGEVVVALEAKVVNNKREGEVGDVEDVGEVEVVEEDTVSKDLTKPEMSINLNDALHQCYINPNKILESMSFLQTRVKSCKYGCGV